MYQDLPPADFKACEAAILPLIQSFTCSVVSGGISLIDGLDISSDKDEDLGLRGAPRDVLAALHLRPASGPLPLNMCIEGSMQPRSSVSWELLISLPEYRSEGAAPDESLDQDMGLAISQELSR